MKYVAAAKCLSFRPNYTVLSNCKQLHTAIFAATDRRWKEALCCMISCYVFLVISVVLCLHTWSSIFPGHEPEPWEHVWSPQDLWDRSYQHGAGREAGPSDWQRWWDQKSYLDKDGKHENIWKKDIVQDSSKRLFRVLRIHEKCFSMCFSMLCKIAGPKMLTWGDPNPGKKIEE